MIEARPAAKTTCALLPTIDTCYYSPASNTECTAEVKLYPATHSADLSPSVRSLGFHHGRVFAISVHSPESLTKQTDGFSGRVLVQSDIRLSECAPFRLL